MLNPYKLTWAGISSLDLDLHTNCSFESDHGNTETHLSREAILSEVFNGSLKRVHGYKWSDTLKFSVTFTKWDYSDFDDIENRKILAWLTSSQNAAFLDVYKDDSYVIAWSALGNWVNVSQYKLGNGRVVGYVAEFESVSSFAFSPLRVVEKTITAPATFTINCYTDDLRQPVYPKITITENNSVVVEAAQPMTNISDHILGTVYYYDGTYYWVDNTGKLQIDNTNRSGLSTTSVVIKNLTTSTSSVVKNNVANEVVVLDGANNIVSSNQNVTRIFGGDFNFNWIPLVYGANKIEITGNCTVRIEWRDPIKCGEF